MTALPVEYESVKTVFGLAEQAPAPPLRVSFGPVPGNPARNVILVGPEQYPDLIRGNKFNPNTAAQYTRLFADCEPSICLYVGVAGGVDDRVSVGDVVFGYRIIAYEVGAITPYSRASAAGPSRTAYAMPDTGLLMPDGLTLDLNHRLGSFADSVVARRDWYGAQRRPDGQIPGAHAGSIAAGEKVIKTRMCREYNVLANMDRRCLAVDMESYGFAQAIISTHGAKPVDSLSIRGISDMIDDKIGSNNQAVAAQHASLFARALMEAY